MMMNRQVPVGDHGTASVPLATPHDMYAGNIEGIGGTDDGTDVEIVFPVLDGDVQRVSSSVEHGDDGLVFPIPEVVQHVTPVAIA